MEETFPDKGILEKLFFVINVQNNKFFLVSFLLGFEFLGVFLLVSFFVLELLLLFLLFLLLYCNYNKNHKWQ
jgi:hypothetical protein